MITKMPFLCYRSPDPMVGHTKVEKEQYVVQVCTFDYVWDHNADDSEQDTFIADPDMFAEPEVIFDTQQEALAYIKQWWAKQE